MFPCNLTFHDGVCTQIHKADKFMMHTNPWCTQIHDVNKSITHTNSWCTQVHDAQKSMIHTNPWCKQIHYSHKFMIHTNPWCTQIHMSKQQKKPMRKMKNNCELLLHTHMWLQYHMLISAVCCIENHLLWLTFLVNKQKRINLTYIFCYAEASPLIAIKVKVKIVYPYSKV